MKTLLVTNRKGGVGKTTTSINLAINLALDGYKVLLIDFDTQGHLQLGLGSHEHPIIGIHDMLKIGRFSKKGIKKSSIKNLDYIPAHINFDISTLSSKSSNLKKIFKKIDQKHEYDFCIIDTPPTSDMILKNILKISDYILVPMQCEYLSFVGVLQFLRLLYMHLRKIKSDIELLGVVPTMYNDSLQEHQKLIKKINLDLGSDKVFSPIRKDIKLSNAFLDGIPLCLKDIRSKGLEDYKVMTQEVVKKIKGVKNVSKNNIG